MEHPRSILQTSLFSLEGIRDFGCWILDLWTWLYFSRILSEDSKIENGPIAQSRLERTPDKREVVGSIPTRPTNWIDDFILRDINPKIENPFGGVAQLGEHLLCTQEVIGSIPFTSTRIASKLKERSKKTTEQSSRFASSFEP